MQLFEWIEKNGRHRFMYDADGNGCFYFVKTLLTDMKEEKWFEDSELVKKNFNTINSYKKGTIIDGDCYIPFGIGTFYKPEAMPKPEGKTVVTGRTERRPFNLNISYSPNRSTS